MNPAQEDQRGTCNRLTHTFPEFSVMLPTLYLCPLHNLVNAIRRHMLNTLWQVRFLGGIRAGLTCLQVNVPMVLAGSKQQH